MTPRLQSSPISPITPSHFALPSHSQYVLYYSSSKRSPLPVLFDTPILRGRRSSRTYSGHYVPAGLADCPSDLLFPVNNARAIHVDDDENSPPRLCELEQARNVPVARLVSFLYPPGLAINVTDNLFWVICSLLLTVIFCPRIRSFQDMKHIIYVLCLCRRSCPPLPSRV